MKLVPATDTGVRVAFNLFSTIISQLDNKIQAVSVVLNRHTIIFYVFRIMPRITAFAIYEVILLPLMILP